MAQGQGRERRDREEKEVIIYIISYHFVCFFQRFIPEITAGPATLLHGGCVKGPYRISTSGGDCFDRNGGGPFACGCCCCA